MSVRVIDVVVRCKDEMPFTKKTLEALLGQTGVRPRPWLFDDGSTDGSREAARALGVPIVDREPGPYVPGRVLNRAMRHVGSEIVAFVNADAIPTRPISLAALVAPFDEDPSLAATFGRQVARPEADPLVRAEYERAFGLVEPVRTRRGRFFSMAASAIRRTAWEQAPFDEQLSYSEDVAWTTRVEAAGARVRYVPAARFEHSHDYDLGGLARRRRGEGAAERRIHELGPPSWVDDLARPLVGALVRDAKHGLLSPRSVAVRVAQAAGYYAGLRGDPR